MPVLTGTKPSVSRPASRRSRGLPSRKEVLAIGVCVIAVVATLYIVLRPAAADPSVTSVSAAQSAPVTMTKWGPLSGMDRLLLTKVRQAGLWEMPSGQLAQTRASSPLVKAAGAKIMAEHNVLDQDTRTVAAQLGVPLPNTPNADQQSWLAELNTKTGADFDQDFVFRLRAAHGKVFQVVATLRATTQNTLIRDFSQRAMLTVLRHMSYLEATGLVNAQALTS